MMILRQDVAMANAAGDSKSPKKSEVTRAKIVDAALELFLEKGYDKTTMRAIADRAGVSIGNAYYYFDSKDALMQGYYELLNREFEAKVEPILAEETDFQARLIKTLTAWVDNARRHHQFAGNFFRYAAQPGSPLSPFSDESAVTRAASTAIYRRVVEGSKRLRVSEEVKAQLPELLWLYQMGVVLYWVYDSSPQQRNTIHLIERTVPLITKLLGLSRIPGLKNIAGDLMVLFEDLTAAEGGPKSTRSTGSS